jgi:hypothetical protein
VLHGLTQQILEQIERRRIQPLQVIEEQSQRMLRTGEYADESPKDQLKAALRVLWRKSGYRWLLSYDELELRDDIHNERSVGTERLTKDLAPAPQLSFAFA